MTKIGNLFELAERQLINEKENGKRKSYTLSDIVNYAIRIRKFLDKNGGNLEGILNQLSHTEQEIRQMRYIRNREALKRAER
jgi:hypothetical protein